MAQVQDVFKRYEKKYMLTEKQHDFLLKKLDSFITQDQYGMHTIGNLYFDTDNFQLIRTSIEKPVYKEKLRLRSYGATTNKDDAVFIELKKKFKGVVYKRRVQLPLKDAYDYLILGKHPGFPSQILSEIDWFLALYRPVPKVHIAYDRIAYSGKEDDNLRITFDHHIRFRASNLDLTKGHWGNPLLNPGTILMEIKIPDAMPLWLNKILTEEQIFPASFSKYGTCYQKHLIPQVFHKGGMTCA